MRTKLAQLLTEEGLLKVSRESFAKGDYVKFLNDRFNKDRNPDMISWRLMSLDDEFGMDLPPRNVKTVFGIVTAADNLRRTVDMKVTSGPLKGKVYTLPEEWFRKRNPAAALLRKELATISTPQRWMGLTVREEPGGDLRVLHGFIPRELRHPEESYDEDDDFDFYEEEPSPQTVEFEKWDDAVSRAVAAVRRKFPRVNISVSSR